MPSPFPGMNPFLEHVDAWHTFHMTFPAVAIEVMSPTLGPNYFARIDEHVYIHEMFNDDAGPLWGKPDIGVTELRGQRTQLDQRSETLVQEPPQRVMLPENHPVRVPYIEIRDRLNRRLVTIIELLSPLNKRPGLDREQYEWKRGELLAGTTHLVEIDLLRGGPRFPPADQSECDYCVLVSRHEDRPQADLWPIQLREPLPTIPIPLNAGDAEGKLDLQTVLHRIYDRGGYEKFIYDTDPNPPLNAEDAA